MRCSLQRTQMQSLNGKRPNSQRTQQETLPTQHDDVIRYICECKLFYVIYLQCTLSIIRSNFTYCSPRFLLLCVNKTPVVRDSKRVVTVFVFLIDNVKTYFGKSAAVDYRIRGRNHKAHRRNNLLAQCYFRMCKHRTGKYGYRVTIVYAHSVSFLSKYPCLLLSACFSCFITRVKL